MNFRGVISSLTLLFCRQRYLPTLWMSILSFLPVQPLPFISLHLVRPYRILILNRC